MDSKKYIKKIVLILIIISTFIKVYNSNTLFSNIIIKTDDIRNFFNNKLQKDSSSDIETINSLEIEQILDIDEFLDELVVEKRDIADEDKTHIEQLRTKINFPAYLSNFAYEDVVKNKIEYQGKNYVVVNNNIPLFTKDEFVAYSQESFEVYSELDNLGRCGVALANIGKEIMPRKKRESIRDIKPTGFKNKKYQGIIEDDFIYNRSHLIAHSLAGEDANERNLITGTRYFNVDGMEPFESMVASYIKSTSNHVLYRITPVFKDDELVARGVLMEAYSLEDKGEGIEFCVYIFNVQPGINIDYKTGKNYLSK